MNLTIENHRYYNFKEVRGFDIFLRHPSDLLKNTLEDFFSVEVVYDFAPLLNKKLLALIQNNPKRNVYVDSNSQVTLLITVTPIPNEHYLFVVLLKGNSIGFENRPKVFNVMASCISNSLTESYAGSFTKAIWLLGDVLIKRFISLFVGMGAYSPYKKIFSPDCVPRLLKASIFHQGLLLPSLFMIIRNAQTNMLELYNHCIRLESCFPVSIPVIGIWLMDIPHSI